MNLKIWYQAGHPALAFTVVVTTFTLAGLTLWSWMIESFRATPLLIPIGLCFICQGLTLFVVIRMGRQTLQAQKDNRTKSTFLANMSHEIRSPVGIMIGVAEILADHDCSEENRIHYAHVLRRNGQALLTIIDDILDLSKVEAGQLKIQLGPVNLPTLIQEVSGLHQATACEKGLAFEVHFEGPALEMIVTDSVRVRQILTNLLSNAVKFTRSGSIHLTIQAGLPLHESLAVHLTFRVRDTGDGFDEVQMSRLFQPFSQGRQAKTQAGNGLGLALSKCLAQSLGGDLNLIENQPGRGSVFEFRLPAHLPEQRPATLSHQHGDLVPAMRLPGMKVLLVEDAPDNRTLMKWILDLEGAEVELATNGQEALEKALSHQYDVILMDIQMPVMDGLVATARLREQGYRRPIFALTAHAMKEDRQICLASGLNDHISKPVQKETLIEKLLGLRNSSCLAHG